MEIRERCAKDMDLCENARQDLPDLLALCDSLRDALAASEAIVSKLPKTKDGLPITLGMRVFPELLADYGDDLDDGGIVTSVRDVEDGCEITIEDSRGEKGPNYVEADASNVYSTREAAVAATEGKQCER